MKGCPEGGEQSHLFSLYSFLSMPTTDCPHECGASIPRSKGDFFALHVSGIYLISLWCLTFSLISSSWISPHTLIDFEVESQKYAQDAIRKCV